MKNQSIGILGGTFDPIHLGHIQLAKYTLTHCFLKEIIIAPNYTPPHRKKPVANPKQRLKMIRLALENYPNFTADDREIRRQGKSFMIDTLKSLRKDFPNTSLCLILGFDTFANLPSWHEWKDLLKYANFIVINRPDVATKITSPVKKLLKTAEITDPKELSENLNGKIYQLQMPPIPISAAKIRKQLKHGEKPKDLLPEKVYKYIRENNIYVAP
jgi:nicotinate-nucleotide adenylyltransferase